MNCRVTRRLCVPLLLILLLPLAGQAKSYHTLPEIRRQAEVGWHQTYQAHGRTITVDIPIEVPEADRFPVLTASLMPHSDKVQKPQSGMWERVFDGENSVDNGRLFFTCMRGDYFELERMGCYNEPSDRGSFEEQAFCPPDIELDFAYATHNEATPRYMINLVDSLWQRYFPEIPVDLRLEKVLAGVHYRTFDMDRLQYVGEPMPTDREAFLEAVFAQYMQGIPLLVCAEDSFRRFGGAQTGRSDFRPVPMLHARALSRSLRNCNLPDRNDMVMFSLLHEEAALVPDVPLCSVQTAIAAYEQPIRAGQLRLVESMKLGYAAWEGPGEDGFTLTPAWVAWGILLKNPEKEAWKQNADETLEESDYRKSTQYGPILVNAQTGELIDPWRTDKNRAFDQPGLIRWEKEEK